MNSPIPTPPAAANYKLTPAQKAGWASGAITDVLMTNMFSYLANPIYVVALHLDPRVVAWAVSIPRFWETITDPLIGHISDNTQTRWGRRIPFIFLGALLSGLFFALAWMPPRSLGPVGLSIYILFMSICYYTSYAIFAIPWGALGMELSDDYNERTSVQTYKAVLQAAGGFILGVPWWLAKYWGGEDIIGGLRWVALLFGAIIIGGGLLAAISSKERVHVQREEKLPLWDSLRYTCGNGQFLLLIGVVLMVVIGLFLIQPMANFINILHIYGSDAVTKAEGKTATLSMNINMIFQFIGLLLAPLVNSVSSLLGKRRTLMAGLLLVAIGYLSTWWAYCPQFPYLQAVSLALCAPGLACLWILTTSMIADICELDAIKTGQRREGMYHATYSWTTKAGISIALLLSGYLIHGSGYDPAKAVQAPGVVQSIRLLYMIVPAVFTCLAMLLLFFYKVDENTLMEARGEQV